MSEKDEGPYEIRPHVWDVIQELESDLFELKIERAYVLNRDGKVILRKDGVEGEVIFRGEELRMLDKAILIHNHPHGMPPSRRDLGIAIRRNLQHSLVVAIGEGRLSRRIRFSISPRSANWGLDSTTERLEMSREAEYAYADNLTDLAVELSKRWTRNQLTKWEYSHYVQERALIRCSSVFGFVYRKEFL